PTCFKEAIEIQVWKNAMIEEILAIEQNQTWELGFEMSSLGILQYFLGLQVKQVENGIFISQMKYAKNLLFKFGMHNCKVAATPMNENENFQLEDGTDLADPSHYRSLIGVVDFRLIGYSDSDWAGSIDNRKSISGNVFNLGSGAISWSSKKQDVVALSSSEAKYIVVTSAACQ
ncbi:uncharacterized mitochondrial protein AtMg00810-like, partial [Capsicum annuum]|uniref:uncharacterized mitochondrial protein AtMg00810-like n=1 Tax=Capsicum annuum TaxID=4072 RepID=UPI001FB11E98